jgi:hypothetical protein
LCEIAKPTEIAIVVGSEQENVDLIVRDANTCRREEGSDLSYHVARSGRAAKISMIDQCCRITSASDRFFRSFSSK